MTKGKRILVFLITMIGLSIIVLVIRNSLIVPSEISVLIYSSMIMLSFTVLFVEHFFTKPADVLANTISILLAIAPLHSTLSKMGVWYWIFFFYNLVFLIISLLSLLLLDGQKASSSLQNRISNNLKRIATFFGNGRFLYFALLALALLFYVDTQSKNFLILFGYIAIILLIDPKKFVLSSISLKKKPKTDVGVIIGVQSKNTFIAKLYKERHAIYQFDFVEFDYAMNESREAQRGLVIDKYLLNQEQWIKILVSEDIKNALANLECDHPLQSNIVYKLDCEDSPQFLRNYVGVILEKSTIGKIRFEYHSKVSVEEGALLELNTNGNTVLYQVVQGLTDIELLESKDKTGYVVGEAIQLGLWNEERHVFDKYGWVPDINTPVYLASDIEAPPLEEGEFQLGNIPDTNYPVIMNKRDAVTHHLAILGITGCGKSILARHIIREIAEDGIKVICVDFTNEYRDKFPDIDTSPIVPYENTDHLFDAIDILSNELSKFANRQNHDLISTQENILHDGFYDAISSFLESDRSVSLFELPDVSNTTGILEYTKWFFKILFEIARQDDNFGNRLCIVLEEAHTVIPEWTFLGVSEKKATSLVNSIGQIALQGRKYGVGFIIVAQRTANVSKTVLTQCNSIIAFQQFDKTSSDFLANYMGAEMVTSITTLNFRQAIAVGKAFKAGIPVVFEVDEIVEPIVVEDEAYR